MTALALALLVAASPRLESIALLQDAAAPAVRLTLSACAEPPTLSQESRVVRVRLPGVRLGPSFAGHRFAWSQPRDGQPLPRAPLPEALLVTADDAEVDLELRLPAETTLQLQQEKETVWLRLQRRPVARVPAPPARRVFAAFARPDEPTVTKPPQEPEAAAPPPADDVAALARALFPKTTTAEDESDDIATLYPRLFPSGPPEGPKEEPPRVEVAPPGLAVGPFRLRASLAGRYVDADTFLGPTPTRDRYLEVGPKLAAEAPLGAGRFLLDYDPVLRSFARYDRINSTTHVVGARLELPVASSLTLSAGDRFASATLETRMVDPGGEYFFGLGRFQRNDADAGARLWLAPRVSLDLGARLAGVRFVEPSTFFDYDSRSATAGLALELAPGLRGTVAYTHDTIPRPDQRPQAGGSADSASVSLDGDLLPLLTGQLSLGYRHQSNPEAGEGGRSYSGLTASGTLTQRLGRESLVSFFVSRTTPPSAFEANGFYVATSLQATAEFPVPLSLRLRGGLGWQWSAYRTPALGIGEPRHDRLLSAFVSLRRPLPGRLTLAGTYRSEDRDTNVQRLSTDSHGFLIELEWDALGGRQR